MGDKGGVAGALGGIGRPGQGAVKERHRLGAAQIGAPAEVGKPGITGLYLWRGSAGGVPRVTMRSAETRPLQDIPTPIPQAQSCVFETDLIFY